MDFMELPADSRYHVLPFRCQVQAVEPAVRRVPFARQPAPLLQARRQTADRALLQTEPVSELLLGQRALADGARVLDAGTGTGRVPITIAENRPGLQVEGLDLSPDMVAFARRSAGMGTAVTFTVGDVADLPYPDRTFDLIVSTMSQHHWADVPAGMRELSRVLRPDGQLWIYDFRFSLNRAERAAREEFTGHVFRREQVTALVGVLAVRPG